MSRNIIRIIIAGNSITHKPAKTDTSTDGKVLTSGDIVIQDIDTAISIKIVSVLFSMQSKFQSRNYSADTIEAVKELDGVLAQLAVSHHIVVTSSTLFLSLLPPSSSPSSSLPVVCSS